MKTTLYLGTDPTQFERNAHCEGHLIHFPVIQIVPYRLDVPEIRKAFDDLFDYTHFLFTSKNAVQLFFSHLKTLSISLDLFQNKAVIAIGQVTAAHLELQGVIPTDIALEETQEGIIELLSLLHLDEPYFFLPRSSLSRPILVNYFIERRFRYQACDLYETTTYYSGVKIDLNEIDEIIFTSPSTVKAFIEIFKGLPNGKKMRAIGPVTEQALLNAMYLKTT